MITEREQRQLFQNLLESETENDVIGLLQLYEYWEDDSVWRPFGDKENNWSTIGNQQGNPAAAMVEKLVNSIDAVLMRECLLRGNDPEGSKAPKSIAEALDTYFDISDGNLSNIVASKRTELAKNIGFIATGRKQTPNYIVFDLGEGQTPDRMPNTLLSITESNKLRIQFVQGKFNMGGTGVLPFCGKHNLELIVSKRHPEIRDANDTSSDYWGFTIVRRLEPSKGRRSSMFTYLAPKGIVPRFRAKGVQLPQFSKGTQKLPELGWGTIIKMYEYEMTGLKTNILFDLYNSISLLLQKPGLPIRFYERRDYEGNTLEATLSGLHVRLQEDKRDNLEDGFPTSHTLRVKGERMNASVYAFRKGQAEKYRKTEGVIFVVNGQTHGILPQRFFSNNKVGMSYIADSILVVVDATQISGTTRENLFMNSRDRVRKGELYHAIEEQLEELLRSHQGLKDLRERRRRELIENQLSNSRPLKEVLEDILHKSPTLERLFLKGIDIGNPMKSKTVGDQAKFEGRPYPSYFTIRRNDVNKECHINLRFRAQFETDAANDYFERDKYPGNFTLIQDGEQTSDYVINLVNGVATLTVTLPEDVTEGAVLNYQAIVSDESRLDPIVNVFVRHVVGPASLGIGKSGNRTKPAGDGQGNRPIPEGLSIPHVNEVYELHWDQHHFDKFSALRVVDNGDGIYDFHVNMDNVYLKSEMKGLDRLQEPKLLEARFKFALVLIGIAMLKDKDSGVSENKEETENEDSSSQLEESILNTTRLLAPVILPMINALGELDMNDLTTNEQTIAE